MTFLKKSDIIKLGYDECTQEKSTYLRKFMQCSYKELNKNEVPKLNGSTKVFLELLCYSLFSSFSYALKKLIRINY